MMKIVKSLSIIVAVVAVAAGATHSYFSHSTQVAGVSNIAELNAAMSENTATIAANETTGFPMTFSNMVPGSTYTKTTTIKYNGTANGDLYIGASFIPNHDNLTGALEVAIVKTDSIGDTPAGTVLDWTAAENLYKHWTKIAQNVSDGQWVGYTVYMRVKSDVSNFYQGKTAYNGVIIHSVQTGVAAPSVAPVNFDVNLANNPTS